MDSRSLNREPGTRRAARAALWLVVMGLLLGATGCSSFNREWKAALRQPAPTDGLAGPWVGTWRSEASQHQGRLRCLIAPPTNGVYQARFHAQFAGVLRFGYTAELTATQHAGIYSFRGTADLGKRAGGVYQYQGWSTAHEFSSTYECPRDHGAFWLQRPSEVR